MGAHSTGKGAAIGGVIGVFTAAFLGPAVMAPFDTAPAISDRLAQAGGTPERYELTDETLQAAEGTG